MIIIIKGSNNSVKRNEVWGKYVRKLYSRVKLIVNLHDNADIIGKLVPKRFCTRRESERQTRCKESTERLRKAVCVCVCVCVYMRRKRARPFQFENNGKRPRFLHFNALKFVTWKYIYRQTQEPPWHRRGWCMKRVCGERKWKATLGFFLVVIPSITYLP